MSRAKEYNETDVTERAMQVFWANGYEKTSVNDLVKATGLNRGSLYSAFDGKRSLFLEALRRYDAQHRSKFLDSIAAKNSPDHAILALFEAAALNTGDKDKPSGCLLVNTALEMAPHDPEVAAAVGAALAQMEDFFRQMIRAGQEAGEIGGQIDADETAGALLALLAGMRVLARGRPDPAVLCAVCRHADNILI